MRVVINITLTHSHMHAQKKKKKRMRLTQSGVVVAVFSVWPAMLLVAVVTGHRLQFDLFGQGREI